MNVLMVSSSYPKFRGDVTAPFIASIATTIASQGNRVDMVLPEHRDWKRAASEDGVDFHLYRYAPAPGWTVWGYAESLLADVKLKRKVYLLAPIVFLSAFAKISSVASSRRFDILHAHWVLPNAPMTAMVAARKKIPLVISLHGSDVFLAERGALFGRLARWCFARAQAITAPSDDLLNRALDLGAAEEKLHLIPYGADSKIFHAEPRAGEPVRQRLGLTNGTVMVLGVGRLVYKKGFRFLLDSLRYTSGQVHLVLAGDGDLRAELENQASELGLLERVHFAGWVSHVDIPKYLAACDIFAVPSVRDEAGNVDGLPNTALEAMAAGKAIIASRVAGLPQVIQDGENGLLVEERDARGLGEAITKLAGDASLRRRMGDANRLFIHRELNWENVAHKFIDVYQAIH